MILDKKQPFSGLILSCFQIDGTTFSVRQDDLIKSTGRILSWNTAFAWDFTSEKLYICGIYAVFACIFIQNPFWMTKKSISVGIRK
jgi:hypothetical protein